MCVLATRCFFQRDLHGVAQVATPEHLAATALTTAALLAKHVAEDVAKRFGEAAKTLGTSGTATHVGVYPGVSKLVVGSPLLRVRQHFVRFLGLLELLFGDLGVRTLVAVRVVLHRMFAVRFLDFVLGGVLGNTQRFVIVSFGHGCSRSARRKNGHGLLALVAGQ